MKHRFTLIAHFTKKSYRWSLFAGVMLLAFAFIGLTDPVPKSPPSDKQTDPSLRKELSELSRDLLSKGEYDELDRMANELRTKKARFSDGTWKLPQFYYGLERLEDTYADDETWKPLFNKLEAWTKAKPKSLTAHIALASAWTYYAWYARGYAKEANQEALPIIHSRLEQAQKELEEASTLSEKCPQYYAVMQTVAYLSQSWSKEKYDALFTQAVKTEPTYYQYYFNKARYLRSDWGEKEGDWERFADEAAQLFDAEEGAALYTRIVWAIEINQANRFRISSINWPKMKQGFFDIEKKYPNSNWNLNNFCRFACLAKDRETARTLFERIGNHFNIPCWDPLSEFEAKARFEAMRQWATTDVVKPYKIFRLQEGKEVQSVAFSPDGKLLAAGYSAGQVVLWNITTSQLCWKGQITGRPVKTVAFSPNGKMLAAATCDEYCYNLPTIQKGVAKVWDTASLNEIATLGSGKGGIWSVSFSPDSKMMAMVGGHTYHFSEAQLWDIDKNQTKTLNFESQEPLVSTAFSSDGKLVTSYHKSIGVLDISNGKFLNDLYKSDTYRADVCAVTFSPDGKTLAAGSCIRGEPGQVKLWDTSTWLEQTTPKIMDPKGGLHCLAYSPDGKSLAGGGFDTIVHVWDTATGKELISYVGHTAYVKGIAFSPDSKTVASASMDGSIMLWDLTAIK